jgi:hypothetical protein
MLTEKQLDLFYSFVYSFLTRFECSDLYLHSGVRFTDKLEKLGYIAIVAANEDHDCTFNFGNGSEVAIVTESGLQFAIENFGSLDAIKRSKAWKNICPKCDGKGYIQEYGHIAGGVCFQCNGNGRKS